MNSAKRESEPIIKAAEEQARLVAEEGGLSDAPTSSKVALQAKAMLDRLDHGVAVLKTSIMRADQTLAILSDYLYIGFTRIINDKQ